MSNKENNKQLIYCRNCGKEIVNKDKRRRIFCSQKCNRKWWSEHRDQVNRKSQITVACKNCNKSFQAYEADERLFCSRKCYIQHLHKNNSAWVEKEQSLKWQIIVTCTLLKKLMDEYERHLG